MSMRSLVLCVFLVYILIYFLPSSYPQLLEFFFVNLLIKNIWPNCVDFIIL